MPVVNKLLTIIALAIFPLTLSGHNLSVLKDNQDISHGKLANGIEYYLVRNTVKTSRADMALIQKGRKPDASVRAALNDLQHFHDSKPYEFLARNSVTYDDFGYCYSNNAATIYRFSDIPMFDSYASDSTLMLLFDIARTYPASQAIVIAGDIDKTKILERMQVLSMVVSPRGNSVSDYVYKYEPGLGTSQILTRNTTLDLCRLSVTFSNDRTPKEYLKTPVPFLNGMYSAQLGYVISERVRRAFALAGVQATDIDFDFKDSSASPDAETHTVAVTVRSADISAATGILSTVLSQLASRGAMGFEFQEAKRAALQMDMMNIRDFNMSNSEYVDKCMASYLFGASLAKGSTVSALFQNKKVDDQVELDLFNLYARALLGAGECRIECSVPRSFRGNPDLSGLFMDTWQSASDMDASVMMTEIDTTVMDVTLRKVKLKSEVSEPMTGGKLWTFSNGIRVIYKQMSCGGDFNFALVLKGGSDSVPGIRNGESAFLGDILLANRIYGLKPDELQRLMCINGITLDADVTLSDLRLIGSAPSGSLEKVISLLYGIGYQRGREKPDHQAFASMEKLVEDAEMLSDKGARNIIEDRLSKDNFHTTRRRVENLHSDLYARADSYFDDQFSKCNDGVFVFIGDIQESVLKDLLSRSLGSFAVSGRHSYRGQPRGNSAVMWSTGTINGEPGLYVGLNVKRGYSLTQNMAFNLAMLALENDLGRRCAELGVTVDVSCTSGTLYITCHDCQESGLPSCISPAGRTRVLNQIRASLSHMAAGQISSTLLSFCKSELQADIASANSDPNSMLDYTVKRYAEGRDYLTGYKDAIKSVTAKDVQAILKQFSDASRVELTVK